MYYNKIQANVNTFLNIIKCVIDNFNIFKGYFFNFTLIFKKNSYIGSKMPSLEGTMTK